jgi:hypothetical protein
MGQKISLKVWDRNGPVIRTRELGKTYPNGTRALKNPSNCREMILLMETVRD